MPAPTDAQATAAGLLPALLEQHAFVFCDPIPDLGSCPPDTGGDGAVCAEVAWSRDGQAGACAMGAPVALCRDIAANVLGTDADDELAIGAAPDAFKEVVNVVAAHLLTSLFGTDTDCQIHAPSLSLLDEAGWHASLQRPDIALFDAEMQPMWLSFTCNDRPGEHHA